MSISGLMYTEIFGKKPIFSKAIFAIVLHLTKPDKTWYNQVGRMYAVS